MEFLNNKPISDINKDNAKKKELENKIYILEEENEALKFELSITQDAVNELLFNVLNS